MANRIPVILVVVACTGLLALAACPAGRDKPNDGDVSTVFQIDDPTLVAPFTPAELPDIHGNLMHEKHFAAGAVCGECHLSTEPLPVSRAHEICVDCHPAQPIMKPVWSNHCLSCHYFTQGAQESAGDPVKLGEALCHECHTPEEPGWMLFASCPFTEHDPEAEVVVCSRCHRPHESADPVSQDLCRECHPELKEAKHLTSQETDCTLCHRPHRPQAAGDVLCITCHGKAENEMVHTIEQHPDDCLACHSAHFAQISIKGVCVDCHEGFVYNGSPNQPAAHLDCKNCHHLDDFSVNGNRACIGCHRDNASGLEFADMPREHRNCRNCHPQHTWRVPTGRKCESCHEPRSFFEHDASFHPKECLACHDPHKHNEIPQSGDCAACHTNDAVPTFAADAPEMHKICDNCHPQEQLDSGRFKIMPPADSCMLCHYEALAEPALAWEEVPEGHQFCSGCHQAHSWKQMSISESCWQCHTEGDRATDEMHAACFNCHSEDHGFAFVGEAESCQLCHTTLPEDHDPEEFAECTQCHTLHEQ